MSTEEIKDQEVVETVKMDEQLYDTKRGKEILEVDPRKIFVVEGNNVRDDWDSPDTIQHIQDLKLSIKENNVKVPLECKRIGNNKLDSKGKPDYDYFINDGECRWRAVQELIKEGHSIFRVPVVLEDQNANELSRLKSMLLRNEGKRLKPHQLGKAYMRAQTMGLTGPSEIAKAFGKTPAHVSECMALVTQSDAEILKEVEQGNLSASSLRKLQKAKLSKDEIKNVLSKAFAESSAQKLEDMKQSAKITASKAITSYLNQGQEKAKEEQEKKFKEELQKETQAECIDELISCLGRVGQINKAELLSILKQTKERVVAGSQTYNRALNMAFEIVQKRQLDKVG